MKCFICGYINTDLQVQWNTVVIKQYVPHKVDRYAYHKNMMEWTTCNRCGAILNLDVRELPNRRDCVGCPMVHYKNTDSGTDLVCLLERNCFFVSPSEAMREWHGLLSGKSKTISNIM